MAETEDPEPVDEEPDEPEYEASLCITSETLSASQISSRLGDPTESRERGEPVTRQYPDAPLRKWSSWILDSGVDRYRRLDEHVAALLAFVESRRAEIGSLPDDCEVTIRGAAFHNDSINCSFVLEPELSRRLAELDLPLVVSSY